MTIHKEGFRTLFVVLVALAIINLLVYFFVSAHILVTTLLLIGSIGLFLFLLSFFRSPKRDVVLEDGKIISPCDGEVVVIEEVFVEEYFNEKRLQVSIFMSPFNVHINWNPIAGVVSYFKYHPGKFLLAWLPKSSTDNERTTMVIKNENQLEVMVRQVAGFVARRIVNYPNEGDQVVQSNQFGFIKFGSRVDLYLPIGTKIEVGLKEKVRGTKTVIASI